MTKSLTEEILRKVGILGERLDSSNGANICFDEIPIVPLEISHIDIGDSHPVEMAIRKTIGSGDKIPSSTQTGGPADFYEEVNFYLRGMRETPASPIEIKKMLEEILNKE